MGDARIGIFRGDFMVIRPMTAAYVMGEIGRSASTSGAKGGPTAFLGGVKDEVTLKGNTNGAGLYSASPLFKMMGAGELMSEELDRFDEGFGESPVLS